MEGIPWYFFSIIKIGGHIMIIAVDFDGTIVEHEYPKIGKPIPFAIDVLKKLQYEEHHMLILWTVREGQLLDEAVEYCKERGLEFYAVNKNFPEETQPINTSRKVVADIYIDDRNIGGLPDWGLIYRIIKYGETADSSYKNNENKQKKKGFLSFLKK